MKQKVSIEIQAESARVANGIKKPGQTKEQTKLITAGIEKGIFEQDNLQKLPSLSLIMPKVIGLFLFYFVQS